MFDNNIYYYPYNPDNNPLLNCLYDLEPIDPPHKKYKSLLDACPAMEVHKEHTYLLKSPMDFTLTSENNKWTSSDNVKDIIIPSNKPYIQLQFYYLFWSKRKTNVKLWQHDPPLYTVNKATTWYTATGMIPIGEYTRNTSVGFILKYNQNTIEIKKGEIITSFTLVGDSKVELIKEVPTQKVINRNIQNYTRKQFCPYTFSKKLFSRWFERY